MASLYEGQGRQAAARGAARARTLEPGGHAPDGRARRARSTHVDTERARMFAHVDHQARRMSLAEEGHLAGLTT